MAMIAYKCPDIQVVVVDINAARIAAWNSDVSSVPHTIYNGISSHGLCAACFLSRARSMCAIPLRSRMHSTTREGNLLLGPSLSTAPVVGFQPNSIDIKTSQGVAYMHEDCCVNSPFCSFMQYNIRPSCDSCYTWLQELPIYEPGLDDVVKAARDRNLFFSTDTHKHVAEGDIIFVRYACFGQA